MAYTQLPNRSTTDTNSAADPNQLQDNIEALKGGSGATPPTTTIEDLVTNKIDIDGTIPLTSNWDAGQFRITCSDLDLGNNTGSTVQRLQAGTSGSNEIAFYINSVVQAWLKDSVAGFKIGSYSSKIFELVSNNVTRIELDVNGNAELKGGYWQFNDITAPSNPFDGQGRLYKKTGNDGLFWLPDSGGNEVDLTVIGVDEKVGIDSGATPDYIGNAYNDGVLRITNTELSWADGGDYVTIGINATKVSNWDTAYGWGNHSAAGYALDADVLKKDGSVALIANWDAGAFTITANGFRLNDDEKIVWGTGANCNIKYETADANAHALTLILPNVSATQASLLIIGDTTIDGVDLGWFDQATEYGNEPGIACVGSTGSNWALFNAGSITSSAGFVFNAETGAIAFQTKSVSAISFWINSVEQAQFEASSGNFKLINNGDTLTFDVDGTDINYITSDGVHSFTTSEGVNTDGVVRIVGKGTGNPVLEFLNDTIGTPAQALMYNNASNVIHLVPNAEVDLYCFAASADGENKSFRIYGYPAGISLQYFQMQIIDDGVGIPISTLTSTTGSISFDNDNLYSTGQMAFGDTATVADNEAILWVRALGTVKDAHRMIKMTNTANAIDMEGTVSKIEWWQYYYDAVTPAEAFAGRIVVSASSNWTSTASTQNSQMRLAVVNNGVANIALIINSVGQLGAVSGTAALPTFTFGLDVNTGMYLAQSDVIGFTAGGISRCFIGSQGIGILGSTSSAAAPDIIFDSITVDFGIFSPANDIVAISGNGIETMRCTATNTVLVGLTTANSGAKLEIDQASTTDAIPAMSIDQADISEGCINFIASDRGVITSATDSLESVRIEINGVVRRLALYVDA
ncbi:MAG: hypothetical protein GWP19_00400 [Planctomycetia bacterium]|nr:hypothetical protein [Planctomycetia bacterium]